MNQKNDTETIILCSLVETIKLLKELIENYKAQSEKRINELDTKFIEYAQANDHYTYYLEERIARLECQIIEINLKNKELNHE